MLSNSDALYHIGGDIDYADSPGKRRQLLQFFDDSAVGDGVDDAFYV